MFCGWWVFQELSTGFMEITHLCTVFGQWQKYVIINVCTNIYAVVDHACCTLSASEKYISNAYLDIGNSIDSSLQCKYRRSANFHVVKFHIKIFLLSRTSMKIFLLNKSFLCFQVERDYPCIRKCEQFAAFVATHAAVGELLASKRVQRTL